MQLSSTAFNDGDQIPVEYTRDGRNTAPPFRWKNLPEGTVELALLFECTTPSTREPFTLWLLYGISTRIHELPEGLQHKRDPETPAEAVHGENSIGNIGYDGPLGSSGKRMYYVFRLFALSSKPGLKSGADRKKFDEAIQNCIIDTAELHCNHERPPA